MNSNTRSNNQYRYNNRVEEGLLLPNDVEAEDKDDGEAVRSNFFKVALPMTAVSAVDMLIPFLSIFMISSLVHKDSLHSFIVGTSFAWLTGFAFLSGMAGALETLCGQAYGAQQYQKLGTYTYSAIISLVFLCVPLSLIWINAEKLLNFIGQDPQISLEAGRYVMLLLPALFAYAVLQALVRNLQSQTLIVALLLSSIATLGIYGILSWALVLKLGLETIGIALAVDISYWSNVIFLVLYMKYSSTCEKVRVSLSKEAIRGISEFLRLGAHSTLIVCLGWWSFGLLILLPSRVPNPDVKMLASSVYYSLLAVGFMFLGPFVYGASASTSISNELGARRPQTIPKATLFLVCIPAYAGVMIIIIIICQFLKENVTNFTPGTITLVCISVAVAQLQGFFSGVLRGIGCQHLGAYVSIGAFCLVGMPIAALLSSQLHLGLTSIWIGVNIGSIVQVALLSLIVIYTNWEEQALKAKERIGPSKHSVDILQ